jgi:MSHA biogenesis protein MshJ
MKQQVLRLAARIDALTLRERVLLFAAVAATIVFVVHFIVLAPMYKRQAALRAQISQQQNNMTGIDGEISQKVQAYGVDPDAAAKSRRNAVAAESAKLGDRLRTMQTGLVAPERIATVLDTILRANGRLQLVAMKTLPAISVGAESAGASKAAAPAAAPSPAPEAEGNAASLLYRHGVEVTVRGNYLDMLNYMAALEAMPTQLFWGKAELQVEEYPSARLTLTLYTLSLDAQWMKL